MQVRASTDLVPTAKEADETPSLYDEPKVATALNAFETLLGGRDLLVAELLTSPEITPLIEKVLTLIYDPRFDRKSLGRLCHEAGIRPGEFFAAFRDATVARANVLVMQTLAQNLQPVTEALLKDSVTHEEICDECRGDKIITFVPRATRKNPQPAHEERRCPTCRGRGTICVRADFKRQETVFKLVGMLKDAGITVNQQQMNLNKGGAEPVGEVHGGLAQLHQALSGLRPVPPPEAPETPDPLAVIDATITDPD